MKDIIRTVSLYVSELCVVRSPALQAHTERGRHVSSGRIRKRHGRLDMYPSSGSEHPVRGFHCRLIREERNHGRSFAERVSESTQALTL